jgi:hypothetical protein
MIYKGNRFCSDRCRAYYDNGAPGHHQDRLRSKPDYYGITGWKVIAGPASIKIGSDHYKPHRPWALVQCQPRARTPS